MKLIKPANIITLALLALTIGLFGNLIYMNLRPADPILPGWEEFDQAAFNRYQENGETVLVEIYASWCPTCKAQHEALEKLDAEGIRANIRAIRVDFDRDAIFRESIGIYYTGAMLVFKDGKKIAEEAGLVTPQALHAFMASHTASDITGGR